MRWIDSLRKTLWKLSKSEKCPFCKGLLIKSGFKPYYVCKTRNCRFQK